MTSSNRSGWLCGVRSHRHRRLEITARKTLITDETDDADLFAVLQKIDASGHVVNSVASPRRTTADDAGGSAVPSRDRRINRAIGGSARARPHPETPVPRTNRDVPIELWPRGRCTAEFWLLIQGSDIQSYPSWHAARRRSPSHPQRQTTSCYRCPGAWSSSCR